MIFIQQPFNGTHAKAYEVEDTGDSLKITQYREDLSGPSAPSAGNGCSKR